MKYHLKIVLRYFIILCDLSIILAMLCIAQWLDNGIPL